jgi:sulfur-carrier protein
VITFELPAALLQYARASNVVTLDDSPATVRDALTALSSHSPGVVDRVLDEQGRVREHVNIFVNDSNIRFLNGLDSPVPQGSRILIVAALSGG